MAIEIKILAFLHPKGSVFFHFSLCVCTKNYLLHSFGCIYIQHKNKFYALPVFFIFPAVKHLQSENITIIYFICFFFSQRIVNEKLIIGFILMQSNFVLIFFSPDYFSGNVFKATILQQYI